MNKNADKGVSSVQVAGEGGFEGFTKLTTDVDLYYSPQGPEGEPIAFQGVVVERRERPIDKEGQVKSYFILKATRPFMVKNADKQFVQCSVGDHVWIDERASYARMNDMLPRSTPAGTFVVEVLYKPTKKVSIGGGKTMWKGDLGAKVLAPGQHDMNGLGALTTMTAAAQLPQHVSVED